FTNNNRYAEITIPITPDFIQEGLETFTVNLSAPGGGFRLRRTVGTGTIIDNDDLYLSISDVTVQEGNPGDSPTATFTVYVNGTSTVPITFTVGTSDGNALDPT